MSKTVFEQLEEVQKELKDLKDKQKTLVDQLNEDDPPNNRICKNSKTSLALQI